MTAKSEAIAGMLGKCMINLNAFLLCAVNFVNYERLGHGKGTKSPKLITTCQREDVNGRREVDARRWRREHGNRAVNTDHKGG